MGKQKLQSLFLTLVCFLAISFGMIMPVHAVKYHCEACNTDHDVSGIKAAVLEIAEGAGNMNFFKDDPGTGFGLTELLAFDIEGNAIFNQLWYGSGNRISVKTIAEAVTPVAVILATVYFLLELSEKVFSEQFTAEQMIVAIIRLGLVILVVTNAFYFLTGITKLCTFAFQTLNNAIGTISPATGRCYLTAVEELDIFGIVAYLLSLVLTYLFMIGARILILVTAWKRTFELVVYSMFFPVGVSDVVRSGLQSSGVRYMKTVAAKYLQGTVCLAIIVGYNLTSSLALTSGTAAGAIGTVVLSLTVMTLMLQSGNIASTIVGS